MLRGEGPGIPDDPDDDGEGPGGNGPDAGKLADNIAFFARSLRALGLPVGPAAVVDAIKAVEAAGIGRRDDFYWTLHAVLVKRREHHLLFDEAFQLFWKSRGLLDKMLEILSPVARPDAPPERQKAGAARMAETFKKNKEREQEQEKPQIEVDAKYTVSGREVLQKKDFALMNADEIADAKRAISQLVLPVDKIRTRRLVASAHGRRIDPRRSLRASLRAGGDMIDLKRRDRAQIHPTIVALCDISGSMSQYSRIFLHFLHALTENRHRVHTFLFGTRLTNVTRQLRTKDPDEALIACTDQVEDWSGGTRIATGLHDFNRLWSRRVLTQNPIVLLITDGLERDTDEDLEREIDRLHRSCRRLVWLNPLLRFDRFEARAQGVRAMLPHVDEFRAIHSLASMDELCAAISANRTRPADVDPRRWLAALK